MVISGLHMGGVQSFVMNYYRKIDRSMVQFDFAVMDEEIGDLEEEAIQYGARIFRVRNVMKSPIGFCKDLRKILKTHSDITSVHTHINFLNSIVVMIARSCKICRIISHAHSNYKPSNYMVAVLRLLLRKIIVYCSTDLLACSDEAGIWLYGNKGVNSAKFTKIANAIDYKCYSDALKNRENYRRALHVDNDDIVLVHVGSLTQVKNHMFLIDLLCELTKSSKKYKLLLVGDGELCSAIKNRAKQLNLENNLIMTGWRENVCDYLAAGDIFVFPSLFEGLGFSLIEAQASGLVCFSSVFVPDEAITNPKIVKKEELDIKQWKMGIETVVKKPILQRRNDCEDSVMEFYDIEKCTQKLMNIYLR